MKRVSAHTAHEIPDRAPLRLTAGDTVTVGDRDAEWPAFVFVTAAHGSGWVPERHLSTQQEGRRATVHTGYDTTELPTRRGETLEVLAQDLPSGWLWCRSASGREGWVPCTTLTDASSP